MSCDSGSSQQRREGEERDMDEWRPRPEIAYRFILLINPCRLNPESPAPDWRIATAPRLQ